MADEKVRWHYETPLLRGYRLMMELLEQTSKPLFMADTEQVEQRPKCDWRVTTKKDNVETTERCKSEKGIFDVKYKERFTGRSKELPVCEKHVEKAWKKLNDPEASRHVYKGAAGGNV